MENFISSYVNYTSNTEVPAVFSRWASIVGLGAFLGRSYSIQHGNFNINPNVYGMLIGSAGTRKGTAVKSIKHLLGLANYTTFAAERTSKEKFLLDLSGQEVDKEDIDSFLSKNLFGDEPETDAEIFIAIDEFNDFIGNGNIEFISMLGNMWDYNGKYKNRIKTGKSVEINNPTISILGGNTPTGFTLAFPPEILGQGFFSRLLLVYGEPNGKRIAFPEPPDPKYTAELVELLGAIKSNCFGTASIELGAKKLLEKIYASKPVIEDIRFESYSNRRFTHLLKLCIIVSAGRVGNKITEQDVVFASTLLVAIEKQMSKALGEFGKGKHSDVSHKIIQLLESANRVFTFNEIWRHVTNDLEKMADLATLMQNMLAADKIIQVPGGLGFLPKRKTVTFADLSVFDSSLLTPEETKGMV